MKLWDVTSGECIMTIKSTYPTIKLIKFSSDGRRLAIVDGSHCISTLSLDSKGNSLTGIKDSMLKKFIHTKNSIGSMLLLLIENK